MQRVDIIIDDFGGVWSPNSEDLRARHLSIGTKSDLPMYLIRNSGHVRLSLAPDLSTARLTFRSGRVGTRAVRTAIEVLWASQAKKFFIELDGSNPSLEVLEDRDDMIALLTHHSCEDSISKTPNFYQEALPLNFLFGKLRLANLRKRYRSWLKAKGVLANAVQDHRLFAEDDRQYSARFTQDTAYFNEIGRGYPMLNSSLTQALDRPVSDQSDSRYGAWVATCLLKVEFNRRPILELVEASIVFPDRKPTRARYERLLLPWITDHGVIVSSASATRANFASCSAT